MDAVNSLYAEAPAKVLTATVKGWHEGVAVTVEIDKNLIPILEDAFRQKVPCIIDCPVDYSENTKLSEYLQEKFE